MSRALRWCAIALAIAASFYAGMWFQLQLEIDKCLDRGGAWRKETAACVGAEVSEWRTPAARTPSATTPRPSDACTTRPGLFRYGKLYAVHTDYVGTPRLVTDDQRRPVWQWSYSAFGDNKPTGPLTESRKVPSQLRGTEPIEFGLRFPGQFEDVSRTSETHRSRPSIRRVC